MRKFIEGCLVNLSISLRRLAAWLINIIRFKGGARSIPVELPHLSHKTEVQTQRLEQQEARSMRQKAELDETKARIKTLQIRANIIGRK